MDLPAEKSGRAAGGLWLIQVLSGGLLVIVLGLHMYAHHFVVEGGLRTYADVLDYIADPLIFWLEVVFLIVVTIHAVLGIRAILFDLDPGDGARQAINVILTIVGIGTVGYGIWLAVTLQSMIP
jgi:succinate dehydrogenase hydrophobic anchor subunit